MLQKVLKLYSAMDIEELEIILESWMHPLWDKALFKHIVVSHLINYKLTLNELEY